MQISEYHDLSDRQTYTLKPGQRILFKGRYSPHDVPKGYVRGLLHKTPEPPDGGDPDDSVRFAHSMYKP